EKALQDGVVESTSAAAAGISFSNTKVAEAAGAIGSMKKGGNIELVLYQTVSLGVGNQANNPWLLELPDPITRANWDNYAIVSPKFLKDNWGIDLNDRRQADKFEVHPDKQVIK